MQVPTQSTTVKRVTSDSTQVKRVVVGRPITKVTGAPSGNINYLDGVDTTGATTGSILIYNALTENFEASKQLEEQNVNGGQY